MKKALVEARHPGQHVFFVFFFEYSIFINIILYKTM
jgi:hypothetical protein